jgi:predicted kinase
MPKLVFVQMSGVPGAGKTTVARAIAPSIDAIVIDHDVTKSALLSANVPVSLAGYASYMVLDALARHLLQQGQSVIFDSPCFYEELLTRGQQLAEEAGATYRYIECVAHDLDELDQRLRTRQRLPSQLAGVHVPPTEGSGKSNVDADVFRDWMANMKRPQGTYLVLNTLHPLETYLTEVIRYVRTGETSSVPRT